MGEGGCIYQVLGPHLATFCLYLQDVGCHVFQVCCILHFCCFYLQMVLSVFILGLVPFVLRFDRSDKRKVVRLLRQMFILCRGFLLLVHQLATNMFTELLFFHPTER